MNLKSLVGLLEKHHKWSCEKEGGHYVCLMSLDEIQIQLIPNVVKHADHCRVGLAPAVSLKEFSVASKVIGDDNNSFTPVCVNWALGEKIVELTPAEVSRLSDNALAWALSQNLEEGLTKYRNLSSICAVEIPVRHFAALALDGDVARLGYYQRCFEQGDRRGFGLSVSVGMIERAISIAQKVKNKKEKLHLLQRRAGSSAECRPAHMTDELPLVCGSERFIMSHGFVA